MIHQNKPLREYSTFNIGGPARYCIEIHSTEEAKQALGFAREHTLPFLIIGKGSNCLFDDRGFNGLAIVNKIDFLTIDETTVHVGAGFSFSLLGSRLSRAQLGGLEFASGIPGTVGGAVYMNAGANGGETKDYLTSVTFLTEAGEERVFTKEELPFRYRTSPFQQMKGIILDATFVLPPSQDAKEKQRIFVEKRIKTQPYKDKSAGCIFRNPGIKPAGALIEECGLKGLSVGGAQVSPMHANFIVNTGSATAQDVMNLVQLVTESVQQKTGVALEMEVKRIPYDI